VVSPLPAVALVGEIELIVMAPDELPPPLPLPDIPLPVLPLDEPPLPVAYPPPQPARIAISVAMEKNCSSLLQITLSHQCP
jgi:hypothetical protein